MLVAIVHQERKNIYEVGRKEGCKEGLACGVTAQQETLLRLVHWRFQPPEAEERTLTRQLSQVGDLPQRNGQLDVLLQAMNLVKFSKQVEQVVSALGSGHRTS